MRHPVLGVSRPLMLAALTASVMPWALARAQALTGIVREDSTGRALPGVIVAIEGAPGEVRSRDDGRFVVSAPAGRNVAVFQLLGYRPSRVIVTLASGDTALMDVRLVRIATPELETVEVTARQNPRSLREAFVERQRLGFGKFLDSAQLRRMEGRPMTSVLREMGLRLAKWAECNENPGLVCPWRYSAAHPTKQRGLIDGTPCFASVLYDGIVIYRAGSNVPPPDFSREFAPYTLEAIEYYRSTSQLPQDFMVSAADCGVVVLWSRRR